MNNQFEDFLASLLASKGPEQRPSRADIIRDALAPAYLRDVPSSPQADLALTNPNAKPGKIGPPSGPPTTLEKMGGFAADAAGWLAPELKGAAVMKGMAGALPLAQRIAALEKALGRKLRPDLTEQQVASLEKAGGVNFKSAKKAYDPAPQAYIPGQELKGVREYQPPPAAANVNTTAAADRVALQQQKDRLYELLSNEISTRKAIGADLTKPSPLERKIGSQIDEVTKRLKDMGPEPPPPSIAAYHASPHDFDKFSSEYIGTGEGAQAYGHGLYAAENPAVSGRGGEYDRKFTAETGKPAHIYEVSIKADPEHFLDWDRPLSEQSEHVRNALSSEIPRVATNEEVSKLRPDMRGRLDYPYYVVDDSGRLGGYMDKTQAEAATRLSGEQVVNRSGRTSEDTQRLRAAGIPGIKYLDQGSRNLEILAPHETVSKKWVVKQIPNGREVYRGDDEVAARKAFAENNTRNYVVFDDKLIDILKKYGLAGLIASGAIPAAQRQQ